MRISVLELSGLTVKVKGEDHALLRDLAWSVELGEIVGLVGESGSGKTMASLAVLGMLPPGIGVSSGSIRLDDEELVRPDQTVQRSPGTMTMIFQNPRASLNPTMKVGKQVARALRANRGITRGEAGRAAIGLLNEVGISGSETVAKAYPHQLSGGMCQRVMIAIALACRPRILIADEPTTALDVTIQAQIFELIQGLVSEQTGVLFITHDLAAVAELSDRVVVLYGGQVMETGPTQDVFDRPSHPYTQYLLEAIEGETDPDVIESTVDFSLPGCRFANRCPHVMPICSTFPPRVPVEHDRLSACFLHVTERDAS